MSPAHSSRWFEQLLLWIKSECKFIWRKGILKNTWQSPRIDRHHWIRLPEFMEPLHSIKSCLCDVCLKCGSNLKVSDSLTKAHADVCVCVSARTRKYLFIAFGKYECFRFPSISMCKCYNTLSYVPSNFHKQNIYLMFRTNLLNNIMTLSILHFRQQLQSVLNSLSRYICMLSYCFLLFSFIFFVLSFAIDWHMPF